MLGINAHTMEYLIGSRIVCKVTNILRQGQMARLGVRGFTTLFTDIRMLL